MTNIAGPAGRDLGKEWKRLMDRWDMASEVHARTPSADTRRELVEIKAAIDRVISDGVAGRRGNLSFRFATHLLPSGAGAVGEDETVSARSRRAEAVR